MSDEEKMEIITKTFIQLYDVVFDALGLSEEERKER